MQLFDLTGKTALVTGASSGLGERFAKILSSVGARVILASRRLDKLRDLASELKNAVALEMDVADKLSVLAAFKKLENLGEHLDICINNAGIAKATPIFEEDLQSDFEKVMQTNIAGVWYVTKASANHMKNHRIHGSIINISSVYGHNKLESGQSAYCASKAAVTQLTKALVGEVSQYNIRINAIAPGAILTSMVPKWALEQHHSIPVGFVAKPSDLDAAILYLASNKASGYVTGSCLTIDGGVSWGGKL